MINTIFSSDGFERKKKILFTVRPSHLHDKKNPTQKHIEGFWTSKRVNMTTSQKLEIE